MRRSVGLALAFLVLAATANAAPRPGRTDRVSVGPGGNGGNNSSGNASISADGRLVAFASHATDLVPGDTNKLLDVFVHDRSTRTTRRVSVSASGTQGNGHSTDPAISADGRYVAFSSSAMNLVSDDTTGAADIFVHDLATGGIERVSLSSTGAQANGPSSYPSISGDGRYVAFGSEATNLVPGDENAKQDVFVRDRTNGATERVSVTGSGSSAADHSVLPRISADGRHVAFHSFAGDLVDGDTNGVSDVFVYDRYDRETERVSLTSNGLEASSGSQVASISADGRFVAFIGSAGDMVPDDGNASGDIFVRDRVAGTTERVSVSSFGSEATGSSYMPWISPDGRYVAFESIAGNLAAGDTNGGYDIFVRDRAAGTTERVSVRADGTQSDGSAGWPTITAGGRHVAFHSADFDLVPGGQPGSLDAYVRDRGPAIGVGELDVALSGRSVQVSGWATFSGAEAAAVADPPDDGSSGARELGAELLGASVIDRPEDGDVFVRLPVRSLPGSRGGYSQVGLLALYRPPVVGTPAIVHGLGFEAGGTRFEARALRVAATAPPPAAPLYALYRCETTCTEVTRLEGSIGTTGNEVTLAVPRSSIGGAVSLTSIRAFAGVGEAAAGAVHVLDEATLPTATLAEPSIELGIAPAGTPAEQVSFSAEAAIDQGGFDGAIDTSNLAPGSYDVWARACAGSRCGTLHRRIEI